MFIEDSLAELKHRARAIARQLGPVPRNGGFALGLAEALRDHLRGLSLRPSYGYGYGYFPGTTSSDAEYGVFCKVVRSATKEGTPNAVLCLGFKANVGRDQVHSLVLAVPGPNGRIRLATGQADGLDLGDFLMGLFQGEIGDQDLSVSNAKKFETRMAALGTATGLMIEVEPGY